MAAKVTHKTRKAKRQKMDSNIEFSLQRVSKALSAKPYYRAVVQPKGIFGTKEFADRLAERTKEEAIHWRYFLNVIADEIETLLLEGNRVNLGRLAMSLAIRGSFASEDEEFDPSKHSLAAVVRALKPFKDKLEAVVPENITAGITCRVAAAMDSVTKRLSEITGTNRLLIQGRRLEISPDNPDEGVWLEDPKTGKIVATARVERSDSQTIDCVFTEPPEPGTYTLVVACRNGERETLAPAIARVKDFKALAG